jgi:hypothetical protein
MDIHPTWYIYHSSSRHYIHKFLIVCLINTIMATERTSNVGVTVPLLEASPENVW